MCPHKVLIVAQDPYFRETLAEILILESFSVIEAEDLTSAIANIGMISIDLVVTDIYLHRRDDGVTVAIAARRRFNDVPIILMSNGHTTIDLDVRIGQPYRYLQKPFSMRVLLGKIQALMTEAGRRGR